MTVSKNMITSALMALLLVVATAFAASAQENYPPGPAGDVDCSSSQVEDGGSTTCGVGEGSFQPNTPGEATITYGSLEDQGQAAPVASFAAASTATTFRFAPTADKSTVQLAQAAYERVEVIPFTSNADGSATVTVSPREGEYVESIAFSGIGPDGQPVTYSADGEDVITTVDDENTQGGADGDADEDGLPATGSDFTVGAALAAIALVGGAALVLVGRRRNSIDA